MDTILVQINLSNYDAVEGWLAVPCGTRTINYAKLMVSRYAAAQNARARKASGDKNTIRQNERTRARWKRDGNTATETATEHGTRAPAE